MCINEIILEWNTGSIKGTQLTRKKKKIKTLLFAGDHAKIAEYETLLQISIHRLESVISKCGLTISTSKTKTMAFRVRDPLETR
jgi:hypothetical protein